MTATAAKAPALRLVRPIESRPAPLPDDAPLKWRALDVLSRSATGLTVQQIADKLTPRQTRPFVDIEEYRAWREVRKSTPKRVSAAVRRLQHEGYVQPAGNPRLDPAERALFLSGGWERFRRFEFIEQGGYIVGETVTEPESRERFRRAIVEALAQEPTGVPYRMLLEMTGGSTRKTRESGTWRRAFADLVESGTVIPARARLPTLKGFEALRRFA